MKLSSFILYLWLKTHSKQVGRSWVFTLTSFLSSSSQNPCSVSLCPPICLFFTVHSLPTPLTVVLNSTVLHKSPLSLAACCGRFYNPPPRQCWGLFHHLRSATGRQKRPTNIWESSRWLWEKLLSLSVLSHASLAIPFVSCPSRFSPQNCISLFALFCPSSLWLGFCYHSLFFFFIFLWLTHRVCLCCSSKQIPSARCVYVTEARPVKGWSPDKESD